MNQRLTLTAVIVMACACLAMFGLMWRTIGAQQDSFATQQQQTDALILQMREDADAAAGQREQLETLRVESQELQQELATTGAKAWATENVLEETHAIIVNVQLKRKMNVTLVDLGDDNNGETGTRVEILIPKNEY